MFSTNRAVFLAFDLGAESGRALAGILQKECLSLEEIHRFPNGPVQIQGSLYWDVLRLFSEMKKALRMAARQYSQDIISIGVDTWGVDFALLDRNGELVGNPHHYRDPRTQGMMDEAFRRVPKEEIYEYTGIQFMPINTLYQLLAMVVQNSPQLEIAETFLMIPDLFNYWLSGVKTCEFTDATTTQFYNPRKGDWAKPLLEKLGIPTHFLPPIIQPGTVLGELLPDVIEETGLKSVRVVAPACHDTGSAVAAIPTQSRDVAYISSGTWSLMGAEVNEPIITLHSLADNFTNEGGVCGTFRFLKNIAGLWLVQECRRIWALEGEEYSYDELTQMASEAKAFASFVDPDDPGFLRLGHMPAAIQKFCRQTGQPVPESKGAIIRCVLESLALKYRWVLERLEANLGRSLKAIHIIGGGAKNTLLCQFTANATGRPVIAGPVEATAIGNILMQALAGGYVSSLDEGRELIRRSFEVITYEPAETTAWDEAYERFIKLLP
jgi:rhamnulokinase